MIKRSGILLLVALASLVVLAACGGGDDDENGDNGGNGNGDGGSSVDMEMGEMYFEPESVTAEAGSSLTVNLENAGSQLHDFTIDDLGGERVHVEVPAGEEDSASLELPDDAGEIVFYCSVPGHRGAGMEGTITVE